MTWINQLTQTIQYGEHEIVLTVRGEKVLDHAIELNLVKRVYTILTGVDFAEAKILETDVEWQAASYLTTLLNRTVSIKGLPGKWATPDGDDKAIKEAYKSLQELPRPVFEGWNDLISKAKQPPGDPDLFPPTDLTDDQLGSESVQKKEKILNPT